MGWAIKRAIKEPFTQPIWLKVTMVAKRPYDCDNVVVAAKMLLDTMRALGTLINDNPGHVRPLILDAYKGPEDKLIIKIGYNDVGAIPQGGDLGNIGT
jgi:hypothetical protein